MRMPGLHARCSALSRRDLLRVGAGTLLGIDLASVLRLQASTPRREGPGWGRAKSVLLVFLQGGPSHLDLWDPKEEVPDDVKSAFKTLPSKVPGMEVTELRPRLAQVTDKLTVIRSMKIGRAHV